MFLKSLSVSRFLHWKKRVSGDIVLKPGIEPDLRISSPLLSKELISEIAACLLAIDNITTFQTCQARVFILRRLRCTLDSPV